MDCHAIKLREVPKRYPVNGTFELTTRCNLKCKMCLFRRADCERDYLLAHELTKDQWIDLARQAAKAGTISLLITGGEPMLRPDFCEIWEGIYKEGFLMELYTNGTLVTPKIMETLRKYPPHKIGVTIYGASPETYEKVCGNGTMYQKAIDGFHQLLTLPSKVSFRTTVIKDNHADFNELHDFIFREFGKQYKLTHTVMVTQSVRGACADVNTCRLSPEDSAMLAFERNINLIKDFFGDQYDERNLHFEQKDLSEDSVFAPRLSIWGCSSGMDQYTITWEGKMVGCQMIDLFHTNPLEEGFMEAWERYPFTVKLPPINETCRTCKNSHLCNSCAASRYAETGDLAGRPTYVCKHVEATQRIINNKGV